MKILNFENVIYESGDKRILDSANLDVNKNDFITVTGPSGSGKTTLLRLCNNLISPSSGEILFKGRKLEEYTPVELRKNIALCFQMPYLFGDTVYENMVFPFHIRKKDYDETLVENIISKVNLKTSILEGKVRNLSGGEKQRISIARTILFNPEILLLDEVTSALDEENTLIIEKLVSELNANGTTVLWITHNKAQNDRVGNRSIVVENGKVTEEMN